MNIKFIKKDLENERQYWWLRSADSYGSSFVGDVGSYGDVDYSYYAGNYYGVLSACLII